MSTIQNLYGKVDGIIFVGENSALRSDIIKLSDKNYPLVLIENAILYSWSRKHKCG